MRTAAAIVLLVPSLLHAHDLWLIPPEAALPGRVATVEARSGTEFPLGEQAPDPAKFRTRQLVGPRGEVLTLDAAGTAGSSGLLRFTPAGPGLYAAAVTTEPKLIELPAEEFNRYLVSDGLPHVYLQRSKDGTLNKPGRERYSKSPKCLLRVGDGTGDPTRPLGLPLEIVPLRDPFAVKPGEALAVRVLFQGKPLPGANLGWAAPGGGEFPAGTVRSDDRGEALVPVAKPALMTIRLTHMTRPKLAEHEWESFWTTLTWHVPN